MAVMTKCRACTSTRMYMFLPLVIEVPHAGDLVEKNEFDTVYHAHVSEFSVKSLVDLLAFFDLVVPDVVRLPVHGLCSPGMHIPVVPAERVLEDQPDDLLILAWNFGEEIMRQQEDIAAAAGSSSSQSLSRRSSGKRRSDVGDSLRDGTVLIIITGGTGGLDSQLVRRLVQDGARPHIV